MHLHDTPPATGAWARRLLPAQPPSSRCLTRVCPQHATCLVEGTGVPAEQSHEELSSAELVRGCTARNAEHRGSILNFRKVFFRDCTPSGPGDLASDGKNFKVLRITSPHVPCQAFWSEYPDFSRKSRGSSSTVASVAYSPVAIPPPCPHGALCSSGRPAQVPLGFALLCTNTLQGFEQELAFTQERQFMGYKLLDLPGWCLYENNRPVKPADVAMGSTEGWIRLRLTTRSVAESHH